MASTRSRPFGTLENCSGGQTGRVIVGVTGPMERRTGSSASDVIWKSDHMICVITAISIPGQHHRFLSSCLPPCLSSALPHIRFGLGGWASAVRLTLHTMVCGIQFDFIFPGYAF